jgi:MoxR-like ATPase
MTVRKLINELQNRVAKDIVGQEGIIEALVVGLLSNGNLLVEGLPGLAKTRAIRSLSSNIEGTFSRIQFTPDITALDIVGREMFYKNEKAGIGEEDGVFRFNKGPIFNNFVLADEVNRAPPRSQNTILEAMEERQVTSRGISHKVPDLFLVMATMNPAGQEGTFPMPEAQMDRFLMQVVVTYPKEDAEADIVRLIRHEQSQKVRQQKAAATAAKAEKIITSQETIFGARAEIDEIEVPPHVEKYIIDLIFATRFPQRYTYELKSWILVGASPRGSLALDRCARTQAWIRGQKRVEIENVQMMLKPVLRHRLIRGERAISHRITTEDICEEMIELVPVPAEKATAAAKG